MLRKLASSMASASMVMMPVALFATVIPIEFRRVRPSSPARRCDSSFVVDITGLPGRTAYC